MNLFFAADGSQFDYQNLKLPQVMEALKRVVASRQGFSEGRLGFEGGRYVREFIEECYVTVKGEDRPNGNVVLPNLLSDLEMATMERLCQSGYVVSAEGLNGLEITFESVFLLETLNWWDRASAIDREGLEVYRVDYDDYVGKVSYIPIQDVFDMAYCTYSNKRNQV